MAKTNKIKVTTRKKFPYGGLTSENFKLDNGIGTTLNMDFPGANINATGRMSSSGPYLDYSASIEKGPLRLTGTQNNPLLGNQQPLSRNIGANLKLGDFNVGTGSTTWKGEDWEDKVQNTYLRYRRKLKGENKFTDVNIDVNKNKDNYSGNISGATPILGGTGTLGANFEYTPDTKGFTGVNAGWSKTFANGGIVNDNEDTMKKKYAFGGQTNSNIEAEGNEVVQTPQGQVANINGATHANGGVNLNLPNGSLIFSDRIGIKDNKGKFSSLADRKRIRENTLARLGKRQRDPFQINTVARTGQKLDQEEQSDVALQTMVRNAIEGRGNPNSNVDPNEVPKAAFGTGDYISLGMNVLGNFMNKSNVDKSIASTSQPMPNFNKNYGTAGLEKLRSAGEDLKTQNTSALNLINSQLQQNKQDTTAGIDSMGGSINLRRALRSKSAGDINKVYGDTMTTLNAQTLAGQNQLANQEVGLLNAKDQALATGEKDKFEYGQALARSNAGASNAASNDLMGSIGGIGKSISESNLQDRQMNLYRAMIGGSSNGGVSFDAAGNPIFNKTGTTNTYGPQLPINWVDPNIPKAAFGGTVGPFDLGNDTSEQPTKSSNPMLPLLDMLSRREAPVSFPKMGGTPEIDVNTNLANELGGTNAKLNQIYTTENSFIKSAGNKRGGTRSWRTNNPGNIEYGSFAKKLGAIGSDGRFAIFPSEEAGDVAQHALLSGKGYNNLTIKQMAEKWTPRSENGAATDIKISGFQKAGFNLDRTYASLSETDKKRFRDTNRKLEGWKVGKYI
jgi:hypothetical protein